MPRPQFGLTVRSTNTAKQPEEKKKETVQMSDYHSHWRDKSLVELFVVVIAGVVAGGVILAGVLWLVSMIFRIAFAIAPLALLVVAGFFVASAWRRRRRVHI
jgi:hypothetical protein